jgi:hypothetical protein
MAMDVEQSNDGRWTKQQWTLDETVTNIKQNKQQQNDTNYDKMTQIMMKRH